MTGKHGEQDSRRRPPAFPCKLPGETSMARRPPARAWGTPAGGWETGRAVVVAVAASVIGESPRKETTRR